MMEFRKKSEIELLAEELKLSPAQVREMVANQSKEKERADKLQKDLDAQKTLTSTMENSFTETKNRLDQLEANSNRNNNNNNNINNDQKTRTSFIDDEDKAFNERFIDAVGPVAAAAVKAGATSAKMAARMSLQGKQVTTPGGPISLMRLWDRWEKEIDTDAKTVPVQSLAEMQTWLNVFNYIKGKHFDEMMSEPKTFIESAEEHRNGFVGGGDDNRPKELNTEEQAVIKKMSKYSKNVTGDSYQKTKEGMKFVNV